MKEMHFAAFFLRKKDATVFGSILFLEVPSRFELL